MEPTLKLLILRRFRPWAIILSSPAVIRNARFEYEAEKLGIVPKSVEGAREARWILLDYYDVIVHIFHAEERQFYNLERLWKDGTRPSTFE